jgi:hypothetical protein
VGRIYFAHPVNVYNTPLEKAAIALIARTFLDDVIENPNQPHHSQGYKEWAARTAKDRDTHKGMNYFYDEVILGGGDPKKACTSCVGLTFLDGRIGLGVAGEIKCCLENDKPAWGMFPAPGATVEMLAKFIEDPTSGLFTIRLFTQSERVELLATNAKPLVLSHQETRLRTWQVYNEVRRPYETAHEVSMSVPEDFYPPKK